MMRKLVAGAAVAILLASFPDVTVGQASADARTDARVTSIKDVSVEYGDGPVTQDEPNQRVRISFPAESGDRVRLLTNRDGGATRSCEQVTLSDDAGVLARDRSHFWLLEHGGVHVFEFDPCDGATEPVTLQLTRLRVTPLDASGATPVPCCGFEEAIEVTVPATGTLAIRPTENGLFFHEVLPPTGPLRRASATVAFFEAGRALFGLSTPNSRPMPANLTRPMQPGERFLLLPSWDAYLISTQVPTVDATIDGPAVAFNDVQHVAFRATAGELVFASHKKPTNWRDRLWLALVAPDGSVVADAGFPDLWRIPETGDYRLVVAAFGRASTSPSLAIRSVRSIGSLSADGTPTSFAATKKGRPVLATVDLERRTRYALRATGVELPKGWTGRIAPSSPPNCASFGLGGCHTIVGYVDADEHTSATFRAGHNPNSWLVLMDPGLRATGHVRLAIKPLP
jgi:hypothetical protein